LAKNGKTQEIVEMLRLNRVLINSIDSQRFTSLMWATKNGHEKLASILLNYCINVNVKDKVHGNTALMLSALHGQEVIAKNLIANSADINTVNRAGNNALILAVNNNQENIARYLVQSNSDLNLIGSYGNSALTDAAAKGNEVIVNMLLIKNANVNARGFYDSNTALILAAREGHELIVNMLLLYNAELDLKDDWGYSALISASRNGHSSIVDILLSKNADVNISNNDGDTAIMEASNRAIAFALVDHNADMNVRNNYKRNAAYYLRDRLGEDVLLTLNFLLRKNFLLFLHGCEPLVFREKKREESVSSKLSLMQVSVSTPVASPSSSRSQRTGRSLIKMLQDPYWKRSVLEYFSVLPQ